MNSKPIYVEIKMMTNMDELWKHTQSPDLHQQWDLRFSEITYLPRDDGDNRQTFLYRTRIGFGLNIAGTGITKAMREERTGERVSALAFGSDQAVSLIRKGGGYWKYKPTDVGDGVTFITQYDYRTRFGAFGEWVDRIAFRPLFGYATAWSFDMLRIWLEKQVSPAVSLQRAFMHYLSVIVLALTWLYQGIVPKLLYPESGEIELLRQTGWFPGLETMVLPCVGVAEVAFALLLCLQHRRKWVYQVQAWSLILLGIAAVWGTPELLQSPFNPLTFNLSLFVLSFFASRTIEDLPDASRCKRKPDPK
ncbi:DoxX-like family protein [Cohnella abietis]|uniref:Membrane protein n=1 Tax=Cohnella abietis TaxID=2507935 RepID=A0A3T1D8R0_9BACL|nr:DoxX-like family protein [Cohnella abietis]BBI34463.1 membrane protein [Cohnella abietis]